ncbi:hypothetical protein HOK00_06940 [bacterium]|nr:hypothetical protein [bacterium]
MKNNNIHLKKLKELEIKDVKINKNFIEKELLKYDEGELLKEGFVINSSIKSKKHYSLSINREDTNYKKFLKKFIEKYWQYTGVDKVELSKEFNTHYSSNTHSILIINENKKLHYKLLIIDNDEIKLNGAESFKQSNEIALIIENQHTFLNFNNYFEKQKALKKLDYSNIDLIYGNGKNILNQKNEKYLKKYKKIYTFFDLDVAGFEMYVSLKKKLKEQEVENIFVESLEKYFKETAEKVTKDDNDKIYGFIQRNKEWLEKEDFSVLNLMELNSKKLEQEIFLN